MIIITGASRGIGAYLLDQLVLSGESVLGFYNSTPPIRHLEFYYQLNVEDESAIEHFTDTYTSKLRDLVLLNCAGINYNSYSHKCDIEAWKRVVNVNLVGSYQMIRNLLPIMREQSFGRIVNFSSVVAQKGVPGTSAYAASKSALWGMTKTIAIENATKNITVNNLNLGYFDLGMIEDIPGNIREQIKENIPMKKFGTPDEILRVVRLLVSSNYITGTNIDINGGLV